MNPKIAKAIDALREETVSSNHSQETARVLRHVEVKKSSTARRNVLLGSLPTAGAAAAVAFFAFVPRNNDGQAWAQALSNSAVATKVHQWVEQDGKKIFENWMDGEKFSMTMYYGNNIDHFYATDGKDLFYYWGGAHAWTGKPAGEGRYIWTQKLKKPVSPPVGAFIGMTPVQEAFPIKESMIMQLYKIDKAKSPGEVIHETLDGKDVLVSTWPLSMGPVDTKLKIYVDPKTPAVVRIDEIGKNGTQVWRFEYPASVDSKVFAPLDLPGVPRYDMEADRKKLTGLIQKGIETKTYKGVKVKLLGVIREPRTNSVIVLWDGIIPNHQGDQVAEVIGNKTIMDVTPADLTTFKYSLESEKDYVDGGNYAASGLLLERPIGNTISVRIPVLQEDRRQRLYNTHKQFVGYYGRKIGMVEFKNVPVVTVGSLHALGEFQVKGP